MSSGGWWWLWDAGGRVEGGEGATPPPPTRHKVRERAEPDRDDAPDGPATATVFDAGARGGGEGQKRSGKREGEGGGEGVSFCRSFLAQLATPEQV